MVYYKNGHMRADQYLLDGKIEEEQKIYDEKGKLVKETILNGETKRK
jgi:antitoxin component YwqK of YwqJK toxin-antitoxin module